MAEAQPLPPEDFIKDPETLAIKHVLMGKMKQSEVYSSISDSTKSIAGPVLGVGLGMAATALVTGAALPIGALAVIGVGLAITAISVVTGYLSSHVYHGSAFDQSEFNAKDTARHLVNALKENNMCLSEEHEGNCRADGKQWAQVVRQQPAVAQVAN